MARAGPRTLDVGRLRTISRLVAGAALASDFVDLATRGSPPPGAVTATLPHMTVRRWLVAVAVVGVALGAGIEADRLASLRSRHLARAAYHAEREGRFRQRQRFAAWTAVVFAEGGRTRGELAALDTAFDPLLVASGYSPFGDYFDFDDRFRAGRVRAARRAAARDERSASYHARLKGKYTRAAARPWAPVTTDPPAPE